MPGRSGGGPSPLLPASRMRRLGRWLTSRRAPAPAAMPAGPRTLWPRSLGDLPVLDDPGALASAPSGRILWIDGPGPVARGWMDPVGHPYLMVLENAVFYPIHSLPRDLPPAAGLPKGLGGKNMGLLIGADGSVYPDSFGKSFEVHGVVRPGTGPDAPWRAELPAVRERLTGTHLFAELVYAHFGHAIVDMPSRLWPIEAGLVRAADLDGVVATGMLGTGPRGQRLPGYARAILAACGVPEGLLRVYPEPVEIERLIVPRRIAPYMGLMHPLLNRTLHAAGARLATGAAAPGSGRKLWLSRSRLRSDPRGGSGLARLDDLFAGLGFEVVHPQEMPLDEQVAMVRAASHIAGPVGSQLHLCGFADTPGLKVLTVTPDYFRLPINSRLLAGQGGSETEFLVPLEPPEGVRHVAAWTMPPALDADLARVARDWAAG